nr:hypothetical protein [Tanacetum cinerariifolium]
MFNTNINQQESGNFQQQSEAETQQEEEDETIPNPSSKKPGSRGERVKKWRKKMLTRNRKPKPSRFALFEAKKGSCFWRNVLYKFSRIHESNDADLMTRIEILYRAREKSDFKHKSAWNFLKGKHKWNNPESTNARRNRLRLTNNEPELFGDDELPRPAGLHRISKSQRSSNSTASSGSNPQMFQEMIQQQYELERKEKMECIDCEVISRVELNYSKKVTEDLKVLQISTDGMNLIDAAIINAQKDRIRALYGPNN